MSSPAAAVFSLSSKVELQPLQVFALFRRADAAQVRNNVAFVFEDGPEEWSAATAARQIVSERW
jgi:hypothetical protein